ncbi:MAG: GWxTD domain-containing protein [Candidatus Latescibacterota bacterium]|nr:MAG: GWxTD domain-containing protein [Candidatus Latescibacterota bacterium]
MLTKHFDKTLAILSLIASAAELSELRESDVEDRPHAWFKFWESRDPTPGTKENEALEEHLRRVRYVADNFTVGEEGWKTDRGKVYITYGEPDEVESKINPQYQGEYLIWHYYRENRTFVFYDRFGLGEYQLTNSSQP